MKRIHSILLYIILVFSSGCGIQVQEIGAVTPTELIITSTLPPTQTLAASSTPLLPASQPTPTLAPVSGTATTSINVRSAPSTASDTIGVIAANTVIQIVGQDPGGNWWQILYPQGADGKAWVAAQFVETTDQPKVPVIGGGGVNLAEGNVAIIQQMINIRSGPGTSFNSVGTLNPQDVVTLSGKDANGGWLQIEYAAGPNGKGWINAAFAQAQGIDDLPIVTTDGQVVGTGTPVNTPPPPTPTLLAAPLDNDSADNPLVKIKFDSAGTQTLIYSGDVSAPEGDTHDWIRFETSGTAVRLSIECRGSSVLAVEVLANNQLIRENMLCAEIIILPTVAETIYLIRIHTNPGGGGLQYVKYTISIEASF